VLLGCYSGTSSCDYNNLYIENGLSEAQCSSTATLYSLNSWSTTLCGGFNMVNSLTIMTVGLCLQICSVTYGFKLAGLTT
jgi:hypothetical protein